MVILTLATVTLALIAVFYLGSSYGRAAEQRVVATVLAEYRQIDGAAKTAVGDLLSRLKRDYFLAFSFVIDEVEQVKKAL
jgi:hypothetical protein